MFSMEQEEIDITKLKYVLYARKSTTDESRQVRSIPDQIIECQLLATRLGLNVVGKPIEETQSAKKPHKRPKFSQMLKEIKEGKYDAILAWNPDRLARNMLEGGTLIDMIDEEIIKDLKFVTHHFTKDANGKMLLGMAFVLSKQYSDDLSQKVTRGVRRKFEEGRTQVPKHGYVNIDGYYKPDDRNFELICDAWRMRLEGYSLDMISNYMNKNGYVRKYKTSSKTIDMDTKILTGLFKDPFYYGILIQANQTVDLRQLYDFKSAISETEYNQVQELSKRRLKPFNTKKRLTFYPFKALVRCAICDKNMVIGPSSSVTKKRYLYLRCDNKNCQRKKKSLRSNVLLDFIYEFLDKGLNLNEKDYQEYYSHLKTLSDDKREKLGIELHSLEGKLKGVEREIKEIALNIVKHDVGSTVRRINEDRIKELEEEKVSLEKEIQTIKGKLTDPVQDQLSLETFLNLSKNAAKIVRSADPVIKDEICREIFLNFSVDEEKVASYQLKPPFDELLKSRKVTTSRGAEN